MLTYEKARRIGVDACTDKLGRDFVKNIRILLVPVLAIGVIMFFCFVGVDDRPEPEIKDEIILTSNGRFPYQCHEVYIWMPA